MTDNTEHIDASPREPVVAGDLEVPELRRLGRSLRGRRPRRDLALWTPAPDRPDPVDVLRLSNAKRLPTIVPIRVGRMAADPFALLRGSAQMMAIDLRSQSTSGVAVQACGDAHLMNFGVFATTERNLVFDLNDFDETATGPWEWDLQRLAASLVVAARVHGMGPSAGPDAARAAAQSYATRMSELAELSALERRYLRIDVDTALAAIEARGDVPGRLPGLQRQVAKARSRDRLQALARFTTVVDGRRVIVSDPPLVQPLEVGAYRTDLLGLYDSYRSTLPSHVARLLDEHRFVDIALKVVGVGSVGTRALMVLLEGKADLDPLFLQIKEAGPSVLEPGGSAQRMSQGRRVVEGQRLMQSAGDMFLGWGSAGGLDYYIRQLRDMKGSIDLTSMAGEGLALYGQVCGVALAQAHGRSQHPALISGYAGGGGRLGDAVAGFATAYADQTERDHQALCRAIRRGVIKATTAI
jgi:uncharacterized protein (DUF2252 family)